MNRSTRLLSQVYSPDSHRFFTFGGHKTLAFTPRVQISPPKFRKIISFATKTGNLNTNIPAMDPNRPESSEPHGSANEDFIHVENPNLYVEEALSESIVDVDNELREENANTGSDSEPERKELPEELSRSVVKLTCESAAEGGLCDVYLVGTAHVSQESCEEVRAIIRYLKPEVVFLELCTRRLAVLTPQNLKVPTMGEMIEMWKKNQNMFGILYSWFLAKVADKLEVFPGSEFRVGFEEARAYGGKVILGDRPVQITLRRTWAKMPLWHKTKLLYSLIFQAVFLPDPEDLNKMLKEMDNVDMLTLVIQEMSKEFPTLMETLVHERDQYMSSTLLKVASEHTSVVAVVGKGHLQGIKRHWRQPVPVKDLLDMPSQKPAISALKVLTSLGVAVSGVAIIWGIYRACKK
ncbi:traB domain-containing protein isoform X1 [Ricinus communis]|uniref:traB domain-containing protein isoform X1 n=1 Tax=Ricinus communis TaxID=3988 RepID=UPI00201A9E0B|nr:traB domain-containing protein isoform X1 [Ricinus communis]